MGCTDSISISVFSFEMSRCFLFDLSAKINNAEKWRLWIVSSLSRFCRAALRQSTPCFLFTRSHYLVFAKLGEELTARGHEVSYKNRLTLLIRLSELFCLQFLLAGSVKFQMIKNLIFQVSFRRKTAFWCNCAAI